MPRARGELGEISRSYLAVTKEQITINISAVKLVNKEIRKGQNQSPDMFPWFLPGKSHGQRSLVGYSPQGRKDSDTTEVTERSTCLALNLSQDFKMPFLHV